MNKIILLLLFTLCPLLVFAQPSTTSIIAVSGDTSTVVYTNALGFVGANVTKGSGGKAIVTLANNTVYGSGWNESLQIPTQNVLWDKIETIAGDSQTPWTQDINGSSYNLTTTGNVTAGYFKGNGGLLTGLPTYINESTTVSNTSTINLTKSIYDITADLNTTLKSNYDTAYTDRLKWDGGATGLVAATGRTSLELGTLATLSSIDISSNTNLAVTAPIVLTGDTLSITQAATAANGSLSFTDWNIFNNKQATIANYVGTVADGTGIDGTATGAGSTYTPTLDLTEINSATFGSGTFTTLTFDAGVTDPVLTFGSNSLAITNAATLTTGGNTLYWAGGTDVAVADGGTGKSNWTQYLIPYADTTTSFSQIAIGTSGQVLTSNGAGAAPTMQNPSMGNSEYNILMSAEAFNGINILRHAVQAYDQYGNLAIDGFSTSGGIVTGTNYAYTGASSYNVVLNTSGPSNNKSNTVASDVLTLGDYAGVEYRQALQFVLSATETIDKIVVNFGANSGAPSGQVTMRIETETAGGPSGTLAHANATIAITPTASASNTWDWTNFNLGAGNYWMVMVCDSQATNVYWTINMTPNATASPDIIGKEALSNNGGTSWYDTDRGYIWTCTLYKNSINTTGNFQTISFTAPAVPTLMGVVLRLSGATTDITADVSRDGGTTYTSSPLSQVGSTGYYRSTSLTDASGQPSGSSCRARINFANSTAITVNGVGVYNK